jgi:resuscitation-promoting factor RpfB
MAPAPPPSPVLRRARVLLGVALLGIAAGVLYGFSSTVEVTVDGEVHALRTYAGTVGDVLERLDVEVGTADVVVPGLDAPVENDMAIAVDRAITVEVHVDAGVARVITAPVTTVAGVLLEAGMNGLLYGDAIVEPAWPTAVDDGDVVRVSLPTPVTVAIDGEELAVRTHGGDVEAALLDAGVELGADDIVLPDPDSALVGPTHVTVQRVEIVEEVEEVVLAHGEVRRESDQLRKGRTTVDREGRDGLRIDTYRVTLVDGVETERELVSESVEREPRARLVLVGTYEPPPPPRPAASTGSSGRSAPSGGVWDRLAQCESGGNWSANTGNGYYGGLQFHPQTWRSVGGSGLPHQHSRGEQIRRAQILQQRAGWGQWPACSRRLGLR